MLLIDELVAQLVKNLPAMRRLGFNPWVGKIPWRRKGYPLQYSSLENSMDCIVHRVAKSRTELSDFHFQTSNRTATFNAQFLLSLGIWHLIFLHYSPCFISLTSYLSSFAWTILFFTGSSPKSSRCYFQINSLLTLQSQLLHRFHW